MTVEFFVHYTPWGSNSLRDCILVSAGSESHARRMAYWILGDLIDIHEVELIS